VPTASRSPAARAGCAASWDAPKASASEATLSPGRRRVESFDMTFRHGSFGNGITLAGMQALTNPERDANCTESTPAFR